MGAISCCIARFLQGPRNYKLNSVARHTLMYPKPHSRTRKILRGMSQHEEEKNALFHQSRLCCLSRGGWGGVCGSVTSASRKRSYVAPREYIIYSNENEQRAAREVYCKTGRARSGMPLGRIELHNRRGESWCDLTFECSYSAVGHSALGPPEKHERARSTAHHCAAKVEQWLE